MKKIAALFTMLFLIGALNAQNLVVNGGFESWTGGFPTNWKTDQPTGMTVSEGTTGAQEGTSFMNVTAVSKTTKLYQQIPVNEGETYKLSFWYKAADKKFRIWSGFAPTPGSASGIVFLTNNAATDWFRTNNDYFDIATEWTKKEQEFTVPAGQNLFHLEFRYYTTGAKAIDNISLTLVSSTPADPVITATDIAFNDVIVNTTATLASGISVDTQDPFTVTIVPADGAFTYDASANKFAFNPTAVQAYNATATISCGNSSKDITLSGSGIAANTPVIAISQSSYAFGNVYKNETSNSAGITITSSNLSEVITATVAGDAFSAQIEGNNLIVTFAPQAATEYSGTITLSSAGADNAILTVTGTGVEPSFTISASPIDFGSSSIDKTQNQVVTIKGSNLKENIIISISTSMEGSVFSVDIQEITKADAESEKGALVTFSFTPSEIKSYSTEYQITSAGCAPILITLKGTGATAPDFLEGFEAGKAPVYAGTTDTYDTGAWTIHGYGTMDTNDRYEGVRSIRFRTSSSGFAQMNFDKENGIGTVKFLYASYGNHNGGKLRLSVSTDQGATWVDKGDEITVPAWSSTEGMLQASIPVNIGGRARIKITHSGTGSASVNIDNIEINNYTSVTEEITTDTEVTGDEVKEVVSIANDATLTISNAATYTASSINIAAEQENASQIVLTAGATLTTERLVIEKALLGGKWYFIAMPFAFDIADIKVNNNAAVLYDGTNGALANIQILKYNSEQRAQNAENDLLWDQITASENIAAHKGIAVNVPTTSTVIFASTAAITFTGNDATVPAAGSSAQGDMINNNWNFVGNPYTFHVKGAATGVTTYVYDANTDSYRDNLVDENLKLNAYTAWFAQSEGPLTVSFAATRATKLPADRYEFLLNGTDKAVVMFDQEASASFVTNEDAVKMYFGKRPSQVAILDGKNKLSASVMPATNGDIALSLYAATTGSYTLAIGDNNRLGDATEVLLTDNENGTVTDLLTNSYTFDANAATEYNNRFSVRISKVITAMDRTNGNVSVSAIDGDLVIRNAATGDRIEVIDMQGRTIKSVIANGTTSIAAPKGLLVVKVGKSTIKISNN